MSSSTTQGRGSGGGRGGRGGGAGPPAGGYKKESILELAKLVDSKVRVKCLGGRELRGILRGYDDLVNLVVDECDEFLRDSEDLSRLTDKTRKLGLIVVRGTQVSLVSPDDGFEEISNPFVADGDEAEDTEG
jgi:U6 snRNA-associated Sm-like protein LSm7